MGGPCDMPIHGETAEEMMQNGAKTHSGIKRRRS